MATRTNVTTTTQVTNKSSASSSSSSLARDLKAVKPVTIATPTTMVVPRPAPPPKPVTNATVKAPVNNSVIAQNISKLPPSVSIIQTPSANTASSSPQASQQQQQQKQQPSSTTASKKVIECVDLSDDEDQAPKPTSTSASASPAANGIRMVPVSQLRGNNVLAPVKKAVAALPSGFNNIANLANVARVVSRHPAPLPDPPRMQSNGPLPPKPTLKLSRLQTGKGKARCLKITGKVSFIIASEASYVYILNRQKLIKSFSKPEACGQTVLPDMSLLIGQKLVENAKIEKFK